MGSSGLIFRDIIFRLARLAGSRYSLACIEGYMIIYPRLS